MRNLLAQFILESLNAADFKLGLNIDLEKLDLGIKRNQENHQGEYATTVALTLAKQLKQNPLILANDINKLFLELNKHKNYFAEIFVTKPGFINFNFNIQEKFKVLINILTAKKLFNFNNINNKNKKILVEMISSNPNGPLHVGHGRHAAYGMCVVNLLRAIGHEVYTEYYLNDGGRQIDILTLSLLLRYFEIINNNKLNFPENCYQGDYIIDLAKKLIDLKNTQFYSENYIFEIANFDNNNKNNDPEKMIDEKISLVITLLGPENYNFLKNWAVNEILNDIKDDLKDFNVEINHWFSEDSLIQSGAVARLIENLQQKDLLYQQDGAIWFRATQFNDEKDRVMIRSNGNYTYFATDAAYHLTKIERGFDQIIDIFGADHHGYVPRIQAIVQALYFNKNNNKNFLTIPIVQFVNLVDKENQLKMSTRKGNFVTLRELRETISNDAAHFFYVWRKESQTVNFDLKLIQEKSSENPLFYIQYAYARIASLLRKNNNFNNKNIKLDLELLKLLISPEEQLIILKLDDYYEIINQAAERLEPHRLAHYLTELATQFHSYYDRYNILNSELLLKQARLYLVAAVQKILKNGLTLLNVSTPETM